MYGTQSAFVGQVNVTDPGIPSSFTFIMPTEREIAEHVKLSEAHVEVTFTFETFQLYILCELIIAARNRALSYRYNDLCSELENYLGNFAISIKSRNFRDGQHYLHEIYSAVCAVDAMQRDARAHSAFKTTLEYKTVVANGGESEIDKWIWTPIIDTGATICMTKNKDYLINYRMLAAPIRISCAGDHVILGIAKGDMKLANGCLIKGVLHVPGLAQDLLSIGHLRDNLKTRYVDHEEGFCTLTIGGLEIGVTYLDTVNNLYRIKLILDNPYMRKSVYTPPPFEERVLMAYNALALSEQIPSQELPLDFFLESSPQPETDPKASFDKWHPRFAYQGVDRLRKAVSSNCVDGLMIKHFPSGPCQCVVCVMCKMTTGSHPSSERLHYTKPGHLIVSDLCGPIKPRTLGGRNYFMVIIDYVTGFVNVEFLVLKSDAAKALKRVILLWNTQLSKGNERNVIKRIRTDNGGEYLNKDLDDFLEQHGIQRECTGGHSSQSNGTSERMNRTLKDMARCELYASGAPLYLWGEAIATAAFVQNVSYSKRIDMTPYEAFTGFRPDVSILRPFGSRIYFLIARGKRESGFLATSVPGIWLGFSTTSKGYRVLIYDARLCRNRVIDVRMKDTKCFEKEFPYKINMQLAKSSPPREYFTEEQFENFDNMFAKKVGTDHDAHDVLDIIPDESEIITLKSELDPWSLPKSSIPSVASTAPTLNLENIFQNTTLTPLPSSADQGVSIGGHQLRPNIRRLERVSVNYSVENPAFMDDLRNEIFESYNYWTPSMDSGGVTLSSILPTAALNVLPGLELLTTPHPFGVAEPWIGRHIDTCEPLPLTRKEMQKHEFAPGFMEAERSEIRSLKENSVFVDIPISQMDTSGRPIPCKWVYTWKTTNNVITALKARFVVRGFYDTAEVETFASVSRLDTIRMILSIACGQDLEIFQIDYKTAFLNGKLSEIVYVEPPVGIFPGDDSKAGGRRVWLLNKALYGLKHAPRAWNETLRKAMESIGFKSAPAEPSLYWKKLANGDLMLVPFFVDDSLIVGKSSAEFRSNHQLILNLFASKDMKEASKFVGFTITRDRANHILKIAQPDYIQEVVKRFLPYAEKQTPRRNCPIDPDVKLKRMDGSSLLDTNELPYGSLIGSLMYLANCTRADISFAVNSLAKFMSCPTEKHWHAALELVRYLAGTADEGIVYSGTNLVPVGWSDASFANDLDDYKSVSGVAIKICGGLVLWKSKKQKVVANSSTMAEYMAINLGAKEGLFVSEVLDVCELPSRPLHIYMDNTAAILLTMNPLTNGAVKHISVIYHFVRDCVNRGAISVSYTPTAEMFADGLTKLLGTAQHKYCKLNLGIRASFGPLSDIPPESLDEDIFVGLAALMSSLNQPEDDGDSKP